MHARPRNLPAKLHPPRLQRVLVRERLFAWFDDCRETAAIWIAGQPGAGKTLLVASWLAERSLRHLWYRFDATDNDLGAFFACLQDAVESLGVQVAVPQFAVEHAARPHIYAQAWFRAAFAVMPRPIVLVLDNLDHAVLPGIASVLAVAIEEASPGVQLLITSREAPSTELATAEVNGALTALNPAALAFDESEARAYARAMRLKEEVVVQANIRMGGWVAGVRLISHAEATADSSSSSRVLFRYFSPVHERLSADTQRLLIAGALLPWMPSNLLSTLTGVAGAASHLDVLCAQNLFIERVADATTTYRLHALFREFLLHLGQRTLTDATRADLQRRAAQAFEAEGDVDTAVDLYLDAGSFDLATHALVDMFEAKLALGQFDRWLARVARVPVPTLVVQPALLYGLARVAFLREDSIAPDHYRRAAEAFLAAGDRRGAMLCAAGALEWSYNTDSFIDHQYWVRLLRHPVVAETDDLSVQHRLRLLNGRLLAAFYSGDFEPEAPTFVEQVLFALRSGGGENDSLSAGITLLGCLERHKRWDQATIVASHMEAMLISPRLGPRIKILVRQQIASDVYRQCGNYAGARELALQALSEARAQDFRVLEYEAVVVVLFAALYMDDAAEAQLMIEQLGRLSDGANVYHLRMGHQMRAWHLLQTDRPAAAVENGQALRTAIMSSGMPAGFRATWLLFAIYVRYANGDADGACKELEDVACAAEGGSRATLLINAAALEAVTHLRRGERASALSAMRRAWTAAAPISYYQILAPLRTQLAELADAALSEAIDPPFTLELIKRRQLKPPVAAGIGWPWPMRIITLGTFEVQIDGKPLEFGSRTPRKRLAILKALVALGAGAVGQSTLIDALWPEDDADKASDSFNTELYRLRKLLPAGNESLLLRDGRLELDPTRVWIDSRTFEAQATAALTRLNKGIPLLTELQRVVALYAGGFLPTDSEESWSVPARERLHSCFQRLISSYGRALLADQRAEEALSAYRLGLERDDRDELFYQGVMRCAIALNRPVEGIEAYQRCRRVLASVWGTTPIAETEALLRRLSAL